ncbi:MAG TPA: alpha/beta fold hydrolase [Fluviicola sp.]|nr:alpha/beta fold hydrolase [Fluviicola sp.]
MLSDLLSSKSKNTVSRMTAKPKLFLFPFAGGNCYSFQFLMPHISNFEVIPLELPGRGKRMGEQLLTDFNSAAADYLAQVKRMLGQGPFMMYGHSLGTYMILKVVSELEKEGKSPVCVVLTGNPGPGTDMNKTRHTLGREDFINELRKLGGIPEEVIASKEMFDFFEPILRSDFKIVADCDLEGKVKMSVPMYALMGDEEKLSSLLENWGNYTTGPFKHELVPGDHFFIHQHPEKIGGIIKTFYVQSMVLQH